jgi:hypothetical protein
LQMQAAPNVVQAAARLVVHPEGVPDDRLSVRCTRQGTRYRLRK